MPFHPETDPAPWINFIENHPLRIFRPRRPASFLLDKAIRAVRFVMDGLPAGAASLKKIDLERLIKESGVHILKIRTGNTPESAAGPSVAVSRVDEGVIEMHEDALELRASALDAEMTASLRRLVLAHEFFHVRFHQIEKPDFWRGLGRSEGIIAEEAAARLFAWEISGKKISPFLPEELFEKKGGAEPG